MTSRFKLGLAGAAVLVMLIGARPAAAQTGQELFVSKGCVACHGQDGSKPLLPEYPKLSGQNAPYLVLTLTAYKAGERKSEQAIIMTGMAKPLSDSEIKRIADYLSKVQ